MAEREGYEIWDRFCALQRYSFIRGDDAVLRAPDSTGAWVDQYEASVIVDAAQEQINELRHEVAALHRRLKIKEEN